ncbi:dioxygenase [Pseudomonas stutzeri]|uniref:DODA-type extradiol aromatic ring-opening family dioxygenase n=1 Tax=Stutzerimonas stutzeri TaxID=316 RepID=UPI002109ED89|nr:class III extradiol ring-cleavage dioxygenase [Stutzerimonas stutzeri]MCQ4310523.1 dioxygenase [Stutzerimonas stutzeri]
MTSDRERAADRVRMPTLFVPHGAGPCFFMEWNPIDAWDKMAAFLNGIATTLPQRPRAIVLVSGHWLELQVKVTASANPELIYDYGGFPAHTYELRYPAPGNPSLAMRLVDLLGEAGIEAGTDPQRGYDHGVFIPLKLMFPEAEVPVVQLSLRRDLDAQAHLDIGRAIAPLRDEGVLIVGSGMSFHNMRGYGDPRFASISDEFDRWLSEAVASPPAQRDAALQHWTEAPAARLCHPPRAEEHLLPLMVAAGAGATSPGRKIFSDRVMHTTLSAYQFG